MVTHGAQERMDSTRTETQHQMGELNNKIDDLAAMMREFMDNQVSENSGGFNQCGSENHDTYSIGNTQMQQPQLKIFSFDGKDPTSWIFKAEHYFQVIQTPKMKKVSTASIQLEEDVVCWYH